MGSLYIKDAETHALADRLARDRGLTKTDAVKLALLRELDRGKAAERRPLRERMIDFWERFPLPSDLGPIPDKRFYDELSGDL